MSIINLQVEIFILILIGYYLAKKGLFSKETQSQMSNMVLTIFLPCSIIKSFQIDLNKEIIQATLIVLLVSFGIQIFYSLLNKVLYNKLPEQRKVICQYGTMVSNAGFMGMPIAQGVFGEVGLLYASIFLLPQRIFMWSYGLALFAKGEKGSIFKKVMTHPCIVSIFIGIFFMILRMFNIYLPTFISETISIVGSCSTALSMLVIGGILSSVDTSNLFDQDVVKYSFYRLLIIPIMILIILRILPIESLPTNLCVLLSAMPAASTTVMLAQKYNADSLFASRVVFVSTLLSMVTLPIITLIFNVF